MDTPMEESKYQQSSRIFIPLCLLAVSWTVWVVFQMVMLFQEGSNLKTLRENQEPTIQQAQKVRAQLDSIAAKTADLAANGNAGAKTIVNALKQRGITINPKKNQTPAK